MAKKSTSEAKKKEKGKGASSGKASPVPSERWGEDPDEHDYPAAASFLSLICEPTEVRKLVTALKGAPLVRHQAKDLLRASGLALLPLDNVHVAADLAKVDRGERLSPVLLVRGDLRRGMALTIADGYHRVCASYHLEEDAEIPCHLVDYKGPTPVPAFRQRSAANTGATPSRATAPAPNPGVVSTRAPGPGPVPTPTPAAAPIPAVVPTARPADGPGAGPNVGNGPVPGEIGGRTAPEDR
jgi:hypothetical protein